MTTPASTIPEQAPQGPTKAPLNTRAVQQREKMIRRAMTAIHSQAVEAAKARVPRVKPKPAGTNVSERGRLLAARKSYSQNHNRCFNRATRRDIAKQVAFVD